MVAWLVLIGVLLVPSAAFLLWSWRSSRSDMALMRATETTPAAHVAKLPPGSLVEVKGRLRCASPVTGELSNAACAHFVSTVERDYEFFEYDPHRKTSCCKRKTEIVKTTTLFAPFEIEDASGRARVLPELAIIEGIEAVAREDVRRHAAEGESVMQTALGTINNTNRTLCFRYREMHLPVDVEIYVLGVVGEDRCIGAPPQGSQGAALPHQRQLGGGARGGARQQEQMDARGRRGLPGRRGGLHSARRSGWRATVSIGRHRRRASCKTRAGGNKTVGLGTKQDYITSS